MKHFPRALRLTLTAVAVGALFSACSDDDNALLRTQVNAGAGGSFSAGDDVSVVVPAGALSSNAELTVYRVADSELPTTGTFVTADFRGAAYRVAFTVAGVPVTLSAPVKLVLRASALPTHPVLGEVARLGNGRWERAGASFFRNASQSAVTLTSAAAGTYRVAFRSLQAADRIRIVQALRRQHAKSGSFRFIQYSYGRLAPFHDPGDQLHWSRVRTVWANLPPATVWVLAPRDSPSPPQSR